MPVKYKSLPFAIILSILYPGLGHLYIGFRFAGMVWMITASVLLWLCYSCSHSRLGFNEGGGWPYIIVYSLIIVVSAIRAYLAGFARNNKIEQTEHKRKADKEKGRGYDLFRNR
jgi:hypothetical protein